MSKKTMDSRVPEPSIGWGRGLVLEDGIVPSLEGKLLTFLEALGLKDTQEKSAKDILRQILWDTISQNWVWIGSKTHTKIRNKYFEERSKNDIPVSEIDIIE